MSESPPLFGADDVVLSKEELVQFDNIQPKYILDRPVRVKYTLGAFVHASPRDWIGLFHNEWQSTIHPLLFQKAAPRPKHKKKNITNSKRLVVFSVSNLRDAVNCEGQSYQFAYVTHSGDVLGLSKPCTFEETHQVGIEVHDTQQNEEIDTSLIAKNSGSQVDSDISILNPSQELQKITCSESPVLVSGCSYDNSDEEWESLHSFGKEENDCTVLSDDNSDIVILSRCPSKDGKLLSPKDVINPDMVTPTVLNSKEETIANEPPKVQIDSKHPKPIETDSTFANAKTASCKDVTEEMWSSCKFQFMPLASTVDMMQYGFSATSDQIKRTKDLSKVRKKVDLKSKISSRKNALKNKYSTLSRKKALKEHFNLKEKEISDKMQREKQQVSHEKSSGNCATPSSIVKLPCTDILQSAEIDNLKMYNSSRQLVEKMKHSGNVEAGKKEVKFENGSNTVQEEAVSTCLNAGYPHSATRNHSCLSGNVQDYVRKAETDCNKDVHVISSSNTESSKNDSLTVQSGTQGIERNECEHHKSRQQKKREKKKKKREKMLEEQSHVDQPKSYSAASLGNETHLHTTDLLETGGNDNLDNLIHENVTISANVDMLQKVVCAARDDKEMESIRLKYIKKASALVRSKLRKNVQAKRKRELKSAAEKSTAARIDRNHITLMKREARAKSASDAANSQVARKEETGSSSFGLTGQGTSPLGLDSGKISSVLPEQHSLTSMLKVVDTRTAPDQKPRPQVPGYLLDIMDALQSMKDTDTKLLGDRHKGLLPQKVNQVKHVLKHCDLTKDSKDCLSTNGSENLPAFLSLPKLSDCTVLATKKDPSCSNRITESYANVVKSSTCIETSGKPSQESRDACVIIDIEDTNTDNEDEACRKIEIRNKNSVSVNSSLVNKQVERQKSRSGGCKYLAEIALDTQVALLRNLDQRRRNRVKTDYQRDEKTKKVECLRQRRAKRLQQQLTLARQKKQNETNFVSLTGGDIKVSTGAVSNDVGSTSSDVTRYPFTVDLHALSWPLPTFLTLSVLSSTAVSLCEKKEDDPLLRVHLPNKIKTTWECERKDEIALETVVKTKVTKPESLPKVPADESNELLNMALTTCLTQNQELQNQSKIMLEQLSALESKLVLAKSECEKMRKSQSKKERKTILTGKLLAREHGRHGLAKMRIENLRYQLKDCVKEKISLQNEVNTLREHIRHQTEAKVRPTSFNGKDVEDGHPGYSTQGHNTVPNEECVQPCRKKRKLEDDSVGLQLELSEATKSFNHEKCTDGQQAFPTLLPFLRALDESQEQEGTNTLPKSSGNQQAASQGTASVFDLPSQTAASQQMANDLAHDGDTKSTCHQGSREREMTQNTFMAPGSSRSPENCPFCHSTPAPPKFLGQRHRATDTSAQAPTRSKTASTNFARVPPRTPLHTRHRSRSHSPASRSWASPSPPDGARLPARQKWPPRPKVHPEHPPVHTPWQQQTRPPKPTAAHHDHKFHTWDQHAMKFGLPVNHHHHPWAYPACGVDNYYYGYPYQSYSPLMNDSDPMAPPLDYRQDFTTSSRESIVRNHPPTSKLGTNRFINVYQPVNEQSWKDDTEAKVSSNSSSYSQPFHNANAFYKPESNLATFTEIDETKNPADEPLRSDDNVVHWDMSPSSCGIQTPIYFPTNSAGQWQTSGHSYLPPNQQMPHSTINVNSPNPFTGTDYYARVTGRVVK